MSDEHIEKVKELIKDIYHGMTYGNPESLRCEILQKCSQALSELSEKDMEVSSQDITKAKELLRNIKSKAGKASGYSVSEQGVCLSQIETAIDIILSELSPTKHVCSFCGRKWEDDKEYSECPSCVKSELSPPLLSATADKGEPPEPMHGIDVGSPGGDLTCEVEGHREGDTLVVDSIKYSNPEKNEFTKRMRAKYSLTNKKIDKIKPGHGSCCTCQECGYHHDDCKCCDNDRIEAYDIIDNLNAERCTLKAENDRLEDELRKTNDEIQATRHEPPEQGELKTKASHGKHLCSVCGGYISKDDQVIVGVIHEACHRIKLPELGEINPVILKQIVRLEEALKKYGVHTADCAVRYERDWDCNCGCQQALKGSDI